MPRLAPADAARLQQRLWTPRALQSALRVWWEASAGPITMGSGNEVATIGDLTQRAQPWTQGTGFRRPTYAAGGIRNRPALTVGSSTIFNPASTHALGGIAAFEAIMVLTMASGTTTNGRAMSFFASGLQDWNVNSGCALITRNGSTNAILTYQNNANRASTNISLDVPYVFRVSCDGTTLSHFVTGSAGGSAACSPALGTGTFALGIYNATDAAAWSGQIAAACFVSGRQPAHIGQALDGYFAWACGLQGDLPASHPYRHAPPLIGG